MRTGTIEVVTFDKNQSFGLNRLPIAILVFLCFQIMMFVGGQTLGLHHTISAKVLPLGNWFLILGLVCSAALSFFTMQSTTLNGPGFLIAFVIAELTCVLSGYLFGFVGGISNWPKIHDLSQWPPLTVLVISAMFMLLCLYFFREDFKTIDLEKSPKPVTRGEN